MGKICFLEAVLEFNTALLVGIEDVTTIQLNISVMVCTIQNDDDGLQSNNLLYLITFV